jgi:3-dehydroshikimate dehydratase
MSYVRIAVDKHVYFKKDFLDRYNEMAKLNFFRNPEKVLYAVVIETHPATLADTLESTLRLIHEVDHNNLRINLDFLHLWESGTQPQVSYNQLIPWVVNFHLKNVLSDQHLSVFEPSNIYSPNGDRTGITPIGKGQIDYSSLMKFLVRKGTPYGASIEWFGNNPLNYLEEEMSWLRNTLSRKVKVI